MKVKVFLETAGNFAERDILQKFYRGVQSCFNGIDEHQVEIDIEKNYSPCDVAIMLGSWKYREKDHHIVRTSIAESSQCFVVLETPLLNRKVFEDNTYFRIGINGFLNNSGKFVNDQVISKDRLQKLGIHWNGWQNKQDGNILLLLQLPGDASLRNTNIYEWATYAIQEIRKSSNRPIVVRTHPKHNIKDTDEFYKFVSDCSLQKISNISFSIGKDRHIDEDFSQAYCTVAFSSGSSIDSIIKGIPTIACDPGNFAYEVSSNFPNQVESIKKESGEKITKWLSELAYSQWTVDEMERGIVWNYLLPMIKNILENPMPIKRKGK